MLQSLGELIHTPSKVLNLHSKNTNLFLKFNDRGRNIQAPTHTRQADESPRKNPKRLLSRKHNARARKAELPQ